MLMSLAQLNQTAMTSGLELLPSKYDSQDARRFLLAWCWQETSLATMRQYGNGPAAGFPQFEKPTIRLILNNPQVSALAKAACAVAGVPAETNAIWLHFQTLEGQALAIAFARLDLACDPRPIPRVCGGERVGADGKVQAWGAWKTYAEDVVRPGKPHLSKWLKESWPKALEVIPLV